MDEHRFDNLTRSLGRAGSRRSVLKVLASGMTGGLLALVGRQQSDAFICRQTGVLCGKDAQCCSGLCDDTTHRCLCPSGTVDCEGTCQECCTADDCSEQTCMTVACDSGSCAYSPIPGCCTSDDQCDDENPCTTDTCDQASNTCTHTAVGDNTKCGETGVCCHGTCTDATASPNCGSCGATCGAGEICMTCKGDNPIPFRPVAVCAVQSCPATTIDCGGAWCANSDSICGYVCVLTAENQVACAYGYPDFHSCQLDSDCNTGSVCAQFCDSTVNTCAPLAS